MSHASSSAVLVLVAVTALVELLVPKVEPVFFLSPKSISKLSLISLFDPFLATFLLSALSLLPAAFDQTHSPESSTLPLLGKYSSVPSPLNPWLTGGGAKEFSWKPGELQIRTGFDRLN